MRRWLTSIFTGLMAAVMLITPTLAQTPATDGLSEIKGYLGGQVDQLVDGSGALQTWTNDYYALAEQYGFDYQKMWDANKADLPASITEGRRIWVEDANNHYELAEGLVAGVPSLSEFDVWLDAGPTGAEDPTNARKWTLEIGNGTKLENPGNIFHHITEPALWGTNPEFVGLKIDMNGDGKVELGEALPNAHVLKAGVDVLVDASGKLQQAVNGWQPTMSDAFTALVVMLPTAEEYFGQWRDSAFVQGNSDKEAAFVGTSRLVDVLGIFSGLQTTWTALEPTAAAQDPALATLITDDMATLVSSVKDLHDKEAAGTRFTPEQAEQHGVRLQELAESISGNVTQLAALLGVDLQTAVNPWMA